MVGAVFWVFKVETMAVYYGGTLGWNPALVGARLALGQNMTYVIVYLGGDALLTRWKWLSDKVTRARDNVKGDMKRGFLATAAIAGLIGLPPALAMPALAPSFKVSCPALIAVTFTTRFIRFTLLASFGESLFEWWHAL